MTKIETLSPKREYVEGRFYRENFLALLTMEKSSGGRERNTM
jgi:hypothetical protein